MVGTKRTGSLVGTKLLAVLFLLLSLTVMSAPLAGAALPDHEAPDLTVEGVNKEVVVTVTLTAHDHGNYSIELSENEEVTNRFELIDNGTSSKMTLENGESHNFTMRVRTRSASISETSQVPYEVYQNDVLIDKGHVNITVKALDRPGPNDFECSTCAFIIPLCIVSSLYIAQRGIWHRRG